MSTTVTYLFSTVSAGRSLSGKEQGFYNSREIIEIFMTSQTPDPSDALATSLPCVQPGSFLTLHYRLSGPAGDIINTFGGKPATLSLGTGELSPAVEQRLMGMQEGAQARFDLAPGEAFGPRNEDMVQWVARKLLNEFGDPDEQYKLGDVVQFPAPHGQGSYAGAVLQVRGEAPDQAVQFDFNHPLAGQPVSFEVQLIGVL